MSHRTRFSGFSLVEMLLAIAIIAVLAAMVVVITRSAINNAHKVKCASNLRQVWFAYQGYLTDHAGEAPREAYSTFPMWIYNVMPYVMGDEFYTYYHEDKPLPLLTCPAAHDDLQHYYKSHYALNVNLLSYYSSSREAFRTIRPMQTIGRPDRIMLAMDFYGGRRQAGPQNLPINPADREDTFRHNGKANALYLDGHVGELDASLSGSLEEPWVESL